MSYSISHKTLSATIGRIYDAAYDPGGWPDAISQVQAAFHGSKACLVGMNWSRVEDSFTVSPGSDPYWTKLFVDHFAVNELLAPRVAMPVGQVFGDAMVVGRHRVERTAVWNEWMKPQNMYDGMGCNLQMSEENYWLFDVQRGRGQPAFEVADHAMLAWVTPHLRRAIELGQHFKARSSALSLFSHLPFAGFVLDSKMRMLDMNVAGQALLTKPACALVARRGHLDTSDPTQVNALRQAVVRVCQAHEGEPPNAGADLIVRSEQGDTLALSIGPLPQGEKFGLSVGRCAVVLAREAQTAFSPAFLDQLRETFGLTAKEAAIAVALASGLTLKDIAVKENITFGTARLHLERIFRKTDTRQQSQVVALLNTVRFLA